MRYIIILFFLSSISVFAQENKSNNHLLLKVELGGGYSLWRGKTPDFNSKGDGPNFNLNITPYYKYKNLMIGISYGFDRLQIDTLISTTKDFPYGTGFLNKHVSFNKISLALGYNVIHNEKFTLGPFIRFGTYRLDNNFEKKLIINKLIVGAGLDLSYMIIDRVTLSIQPNFEYKYYRLNKDLIGGQNINHRIFSYNCLLGLTYKIL
jgi:hypothetical protein